MLSTPDPECVADGPNALLTRAVLFEISWKAKQPQLIDGMFCDVSRGTDGTA